MKIQLHPQGTRVLVRRGQFPLDPALIGRVGTVLTLEGQGGVRYGIQLDGESRIRLFTEDELERFPPTAGNVPEPAPLEKGHDGSSA